MRAGPQLFRINRETRESDSVEEVEFARLGLQERRDIQEWIAAHPRILGDDLLIVGKEFSGFDRTSERLDLLAVDTDGRLVVIELKRDDTGTDVHWQAIKYASYLRNASHEDIVSMLASHGDISQDEATRRLLQHLGSDDLNALNNNQRIILASHRFAPEVTTAVLWLNEKVPEDNFITCVQLTPHHDAESDSLYIQVNTIIPLQAAEDFVIGIGDGQDLGSGSGQRGTFAQNLSNSFAESIRHPATPFLRKVADIAVEGLPEVVRPDRRSRWAGQGGDHRYYHLWYSRPPWGNWTTSHRVNLYQDEESSWRAVVRFVTEDNVLMDNLRISEVFDDLYKSVGSEGPTIVYGASLDDSSFANEVAAVLRLRIQSITPAVDKYVNNLNEE